MCGCAACRGRWWDSYDHVWRDWSLSTENRNMTLFSDPEGVWLFQGRCGHKWVGASAGSYRCPLCGDYDGDHHLVSADPIALQLDDWGCLWHLVEKEASVVSPQQQEG